VAISLNHTIVPAYDKETSAKHIAHILGLTCTESMGHFAPVQVDDRLTLDFDNREAFESHHYAFHVSDEEFDNIFRRIEEEKVVYGSLPTSQEDMHINNRRGGRGLYFKDANGHSWEILTRSA
jgi:catechol 2,3-dioxygenase-like lactoylglutathione lyase family enzyme